MGVTGNGSMNLYIPQGTLMLNGSDRWLWTTDIVNDNWDVNDHEGTISCWINHKVSQAGGRGIIAFPGTRPLIRLDDNYVQAYFAGSTGYPVGGGGGSWTNKYNVITPYNSWHNIVFCWNSGSGTYGLYHNGEVLETGLGCTHRAMGTGIIKIGQYMGGTYFSGMIADIKIYNKELTPSQILQNYNRIEPDKSALVVHYKIDEKEGTECEDSGYLYSSTPHSAYVSGGVDWINRNIRCWNSRWDEGNWNVTIETFVDACDRNYLLDNIIPAAVGELYNILGVPTNIDLTYGSSNTLIYEPIHPYGLSGLVEKRTIGVKSINDTFINNKLFGIKIEGIRLDIE